MSIDRGYLARSVQARLAWLGETLRPTRDADLLGFDDLTDESLLVVFKEVCNVAVEPDATTFDPALVDITPIRAGDAYGGKRVSVQGRIGTARVAVQVDIGIDDAMTPPPTLIDYPSLLGFPPPRLRAYSRETVLAEKLHAIVSLGLRNSRMKDFFDVRALLQEDSFDEDVLVHAIVATFDRRGTLLPSDVPAGLSIAYSADASHQAQWRAFLQKSRLQGPSLTAVVDELRERVIPFLGRARKV